MARFHSLTLILALSAGCSIQSAPVPGPIDDDSSDNPSTPAARSGTYLSNVYAGIDGCDLGMDLDDPEPIEVVFSDDATSFEFEGDDLTTACELGEDGVFDCPMELPGAASFLPITMGVTGEWITDERFEGTMYSRLDCTGAECDEIEEMFGFTAPCESVATIVFVRPRDADFVVQEGDYAAEFSEPVESKTSCIGTAIQYDSENVQFVAGEGDSITMDATADDLPTLDCTTEDGGYLDCESHLTSDDRYLSTYAVAMWTNDTQLRGAIETTIDCVSDESCEEMEATYGELPCVTYQTFELNTVE